METADRGATAPVDDAAPTPPRKRRRWPWVLLSLVLIFGLLGAAGAAGVWYLAKNLEGNVTTIQGFELAEPVSDFEPINVVIMGTDNRADGNTVDGETFDLNGERSDTTLLVHISGDRQRALVVSIPRDTRVTMPTCASQSGQWEVTDRFNASFTFGGPTCTVETIERITGISVHHAVVVDFLGFKQVVDALGGVDVCLDEAVYDRDSGLDLPAGWSTVTGDQALAFVRARKSLGDGSDIDRIARQQQFLASAIRQATDRELLLKPVTLYRMLDAATAALAVDAGIDQISEMASMAQSLRDLRPADITFVTMPHYYSANGVDVLINRPVANEIWAAIEQDEPWPAPKADDGSDLTVPPSQILVQVANGNGRNNAATDAAADLRSKGFVINGLEVADRSNYVSSFVVHHPLDVERARTVAAAVDGSKLRANPNAPRGQVRLIVGAEYQGTDAVSVPRTPEGTGADPAPTTADHSICAT